MKSHIDFIFQQDEIEWKNLDVDTELNVKKYVCLTKVSLNDQNNNEELILYNSKNPDTTVNRKLFAFYSKLWL